ncbi:MAG: hypothetical protein QM736_15280 [Vicinamibacterales bacterium]
MPALSKELTIVSETDRRIVKPGEPATFTLRATDASGAPVRARLSVGLVDEALCVRPDRSTQIGSSSPAQVAAKSARVSRDYPFVGYSGREQLILAQRQHPMNFTQFKADRR